MALCQPAGALHHLSLGSGESISNLRHISDFSYGNILQLRYPKKKETWCCLPSCLRRLIDHETNIILYWNQDTPRIHNSATYFQKLGRKWQKSWMMHCGMQDIESDQYTAVWHSAGILGTCRSLQGTSGTASWWRHHIRSEPTDRQPTSRVGQPYSLSFTHFALDQLLQHLRYAVGEPRF